jgi:hypothetical protein
MKLTVRWYSGMESSIETSAISIDIVDEWIKELNEHSTTAQVAKITTDCGYKGYMSEGNALILYNRVMEMA